MNDVLRALLKGLVSQLHPRMLWLAIWPFLFSLLVWGGLAWWFREEALTTLHGFLNGLTVLGWLDSGLAALGIGGLKVFLVPLVFIGLLIPTIIVSAMLIIALYAMPAVIDHVALRSYAEVERLPGSSGLGGFMLSLSNSVWVTLVFVAGWLLTMPLWLIAPLAIILPVFWLTWLTTRILQVDSLLEHATHVERVILLERHRRSYYALGLLVTLMNFIPPLFFFAPIFSALAFTHFNLNALRNLRAATAAPPVAQARMLDMGEVELINPAQALPDASSSASAPDASTDNSADSSPRRLP